MKKTITLFISICSMGLFAQEHFLGISTSRRVGLLNGTVNPAELVNLSNKVDVNALNLSVQSSNNKLSFKDILNDNKDFEDYRDDLYEGNEPFTANLDVKLNVLGVAFKVNKWAFALNNHIYAKIAITDFNTKLVDIIESDLEQVKTIKSNDNQRINAIIYNEIALSAARTIFENNKHHFNGGISLKLLSPQAYSNLGLRNLDGTFAKDANDDVYLKSATADLDLSYAGPLADSFDDNSYNPFSFNISGFATDIGVNYQLKNSDLRYEYKLNAGIAIQNIGSMKFKDNAEHYTYSINVPDTDEFDISQFEDAESAEEVNQIIEESGYYTSTHTQEKVKVKLPSTLVLYADYQVYNNWFASFYTKQKLSKNGANDNLPNFSMVSVIPRYSSKFLEVYTPLTFNEVSNFTAGLGLRLGGFYIGSSSLFTALGNNSKQLDAYLGVRFGIGKTKKATSTTTNNSLKNTVQP